MKKNLKPWSNVKHRRDHGFRSRTQTRSGRNTLRRRRQKGRWQLIPS